MDDASHFEVLGRKQAELDLLHGEYDRLLALLKAVVDGDVPTGRVQVDIAGRRWQIMTDADFIASSATNGAQG